MSVDEGLVAWVQEALEPLGKVSMRKMMGGATLYLDGTIFAIIDDSELWLKADAETDVLWDAEGCGRFQVDFADGKAGTMNYRRAPTDVYDDAEAIQRWAALAVEAGLRAAAKKKPRSSPRRRPGSRDKKAAVPPRDPRLRRDDADYRAPCGSRCGATSGPSSIEGSSLGSTRRFDACSYA
jgi:DNA transformation protein